MWCEARPRWGSNTESTISISTYKHCSYVCVPECIYKTNQHNKWLSKLNWTKLPSPLSSERCCLLSVSQSSNLHKKGCHCTAEAESGPGHISTILHLLLTSNQGQRLRIAPLEVSTIIKLKFSAPSWVFDVIYVEGILIANVGCVTTVPTGSLKSIAWKYVALRAIKMEQIKF